MLQRASLKWFRFTVILIPLLLSLQGQAQTDPSKTRDSLKKQTQDSLELYRKIRKFAFKYRFTTLIYQGIFVDPGPETPETKPVEAIPDQPLSVDPLMAYKDKIINKINIVVYDPFGHTVYDTLKTEGNIVEDLSNRYHVRTRHRIIRNRLLFKQYDKLDPLKVSESERLLRAANYINDARIYIKSSAEGDSVDLTVVILDKWALIAVPIITPRFTCGWHFLFLVLPGFKIY